MTRAELDQIWYTITHAIAGEYRERGWLPPGRRTGIAAPTEVMHEVRSMAREICLHRGEDPNRVDAAGVEGWERYKLLAIAVMQEAERLIARRTTHTPQVREPSQ